MEKRFWDICSEHLFYVWHNQCSYYYKLYYWLHYQRSSSNLPRNKFSKTPVQKVIGIELLFRASTNTVTIVLVNNQPCDNILNNVLQRFNLWDNN